MLLIIIAEATKIERTCYEGCFSSFPYGTCLLSVSVACVYFLSKHQYLAFDVSLPPPNYLSCSPKQLDSGSTITNDVKSLLCKLDATAQQRMCVCFNKI